MKAPKFIANEIADAKGGTATPGWMPLVSIVFFALVLLMLFISVLRGGDSATTATESQQDSPPIAVDITGTGTAVPKPTTSASTSTPNAVPSETAQTGVTTSIKNNQDGQTYNVDTQGYELAVKAFAAASDPSANAVLPWTGTPLEALAAPGANVTNMNLAAVPERTKLVFSATIDSDGTGPETGRIDARTLVFMDGSWKLVGE